MSFDEFWVPVSRNAIASVLKRVNCKEVSVESILEAFGVKDGITGIDGVLCRGTYAQMGKILYDILSVSGCRSTESEITALTIQSYHEMINHGNVIPSCENLRKTLLALKSKGTRIGVVTTDDSTITLKCLNKLDIVDLIDEMYTDDGLFPTKPDPYCIETFCKRGKYNKEDVIMVGDTLTDVLFAKNGGIRCIGVAKSDANRMVLQGKADLVIKDVSQLLEVLV